MKPVTLLSIASSCTLACGMLLATHAHGQDKVVVHGNVFVDGHDQAGTFEVVEVENRSCLPLEVNENGQFDLTLNIGDRASLRFERDGYLTKVVTVDTRNANTTREAARKNKHLRFSVQMTPELPNKHMAYAGPVGVITYQKGSGLMKVRYDRSLVQRTYTDVVVSIEGQ